MQASENNIGVPRFEGNVKFKQLHITSPFRTGKDDGQDVLKMLSVVHFSAYLLYSETLCTYTNALA